MMEHIKNVKWEKAQNRKVMLSLFEYTEKSYLYKLHKADESSGYKIYHGSQIKQGHLWCKYLHKFVLECWKKVPTFSPKRLCPNLSLRKKVHIKDLKEWW